MSVIIFLNHTVEQPTSPILYRFVRGVICPWGRNTLLQSGLRYHDPFDRCGGECYAVLGMAKSLHAE